MAVVECLCPPTAGGVRHPDGDTVMLRERLDFLGAVAAKNAVLISKRDNLTEAQIFAAMTEIFLLVGIESWTVVDAKGKHVEPDADAVRAILLTNVDAAMIVGEEADAKYAAAVIDPLVKRASALSQPTPTPVSTSATNGSTPSPQKPSRRSSTSTTQTAGIATTT